MKNKTIPKGWNLIQLNDCLTLVNGRAYKQQELLDTGTPVLRIQNLNGKDNWYYSNLELPKDKYCEKDDLLFAWSATFGPYIWNGNRCIYHYHIWKVKPKENLDKKFAFYLLKEISNAVKQAAHGITMLHITKAKMEAWEVFLPPIAEQRRIAAILDKADGIRRKRQEAIRLTEELGRSLFLDMFGDPVSNPKGWEMQELNNVLSIVSGQVDPKLEPYIDMPHVGGENLESNTNNIKNIKTPRELSLKSGKYLFEIGDILYSKIRPYLNQVVIPDFRGVCSADIYPLRVNPEKINDNFLVYLLRSQFFLDYAEKHSTRTNIPKINRPTLLKFCFPCPPIKEQNKFAIQCKKKNNMINGMKINLSESENLFNSLLQRAFRGEL